MKSVKVNLLLVIAMYVGLSLADLCQKGGKMMGGNFYCQAVKAVRYQNVGHAGFYEEVVGMSNDGTCTTKAKHFNSPLSPFDEELSLHIRGPSAVKQIAVYVTGSDNKVTERAHGHGHSHAKALHNIHQNDIAKKDKVIATIDGQVVSWENNWFGPSADSSLTTLVTETAKKPGNDVSTTEITVTRTAITTTCTISQVIGTDVSKTSIAIPIFGPMPTIPSVTDVKDDSHDNSKQKHAYKRTSYYEASSQTVENLAFLGNFGGQGSGVWDSIYGNSLSYINCNATSGASTHQILADTLIPSNREVIITTGNKCENGDCGFVRPGAVAYHGFGGDDKVFLVEIGMPSDGQTGVNGADAPAVWLLNAKVPRVRQYGIDGHCSCWPGCGELDIAEALSVGSRLLKSTVHAEASGGDSDYFNRPMQGTMTILTVLRGDEIFIGIVPNLKFPDKLTSQQMDAWMHSDATTISDFTIA
ncbi:hypothetical protein WAI453_011318 [Rhynchosporium graminicola]